MKKVSVIVPVYNKEKYIEKCITSILNQTMDNIEIIVIDDKSTDNSLKILKQFGKKIKLIKNEKNLGIGKTRNKGLSVATGEYIGFVDADDFIEKNMYEEMYEFVKKNELDIVTTDYYKVFNNRIEYFKNKDFDFCNLKSNPNIINLIDYGPCNKLYSRKILEDNYFEENLKYEDMPFVARAISKAKKIGKINNAYYYYSVHANSETTTMDKKVFDMFDILNIVDNIYTKNEELEYLNIRHITMYMLQQKYQKNPKIRKEFINEGYNILCNKFPIWKKNKYYFEEPLYKRIIKNNKFLLKIYCIINI